MRSKAVSLRMNLDAPQQIDLGQKLAIDRTSKQIIFSSGANFHCFHNPVFANDKRDRPFGRSRYRLSRVPGMFGC